MKSFGNDLLASLDGDAANANAALRAAMPSPVVMVPEKDDAGPLFRVAGTVKVAENQSCGGRILTCDLRVMSSLRGHRSQSLRLTTLRNPYRTDERTWPILSRRYLRFPRILVRPWSGHSWLALFGSVRFSRSNTWLQGSACPRPRCTGSASAANCP